MHEQTIIYFVRDVNNSLWEAVEHLSENIVAQDTLLQVHSLASIFTPTLPLIAAERANQLL